MVIFYKELNRILHKKIYNVLYYLQKNKSSFIKFSTPTSSVHQESSLYRRNILNKLNTIRNPIAPPQISVPSPGRQQFARPHSALCYTAGRRSLICKQNGRSSRIPRGLFRELSQLRARPRARRTPPPRAKFIHNIVTKVAGAPSAGRRAVFALLRPAQRCLPGDRAR